MKRYQYGINLDEGIPLSTTADFRHLYVPCFEAALKDLSSWMEEGRKPLLLGGQIGSGKSTLICKALIDIAPKPDVILHFDREIQDPDVGDFWAIILIGFIRAALNRKIDLSFCKLPEEIGDLGPRDWNLLAEALSPKHFSKATFDLMRSLRRRIAQNSEYILTIVIEIGNRLQAASRQPLFIYAAGLDKFPIRSAAFFVFTDIIGTLSKFKTLFEVNAIHIFSKQFQSVEPLFITAVDKALIIDILSRRMGIYAKNILEEIKILAEWSGGNPRQALRLLTHFETTRKNTKYNSAQSITYAIRNTTSDFFSYSPKPSSDLIRTVNSTGKINTTYVAKIMDQETAQTAIYGNWVIITEKGSDPYWPAIINPIVKSAFSKEEMPQEPEIKILEEYANQECISPIGVGPSRLHDGGGEKTADRLLWELFASGIDEPIHTNLSEILDSLSAALLSKERSDRAIIAFKDERLAEAARAYIFAKANSYDFQRCEHRVIEGGLHKFPLEELYEFLNVDADIYSIEFSGDWEDSDIEILDSQRDRFINYQMLWWIPYPKLKKYLPSWRQLRQLFEIFVLEDELLGSISKEEIAEDISFFQSLDSKETGSEATAVNYLKQVLEYVRDAREGNRV